jgi:hypothetical protein
MGGLTIHEGAWAYCDGLGSDEKHLWVATGGVPLESLVRWGGGARHENGGELTRKREPAQQGS